MQMITSAVMIMTVMGLHKRIYLCMSVIAVVRINSVLFLLC